MSRLNWTGLVMLISALLFPVFFPGEMELLLGINTWQGTYYEMNKGVVIAVVAYLLAGVMLTLWTTRIDKDA